MGADGFRKKLVSRFGSVAAAWRSALDLDGNGRISFGELCQACRDIGYAGNIKKLWTELDGDGDGFISMEELDPEAHKAIESFRHLLIRKFGNTLRAWRSVFDTSRSDRVHEDEFSERCVEIGYEGSGKVLFRFLKVDMGRRYLSYAEIDAQAAFAIKRGDPCAESIAAGEKSEPRILPDHVRQAIASGSSVADCSSLGGLSGSLAGDGTQSLSPKDSRLSLEQPMSSIPEGSTPVAPVQVRRASTPVIPLESRSPICSGNSRRGSMAPTRTSQWSREIGQFTRLSLHESKAKKEDSDIGIKTLQGLRDALVSKNKNMLAAWRKQLDPLHKGQLSFGEFCDTLRAQGLCTGNVQSIWNEFGLGDRRHVTLADFDPELAATLEGYRQHLQRRYGNLLSAWTQGLDPLGQGFVTEIQFVEHCHEVEWEGNASELFRTLLNDAGGKLVLADFDLQASKCLVRGDPDMITETKDQKDLCSMSFDERQESTFRYKWSRMKSLADIASIQARAKESRDLDVGADDLDAVKALFVNKYGSLAAGWRKALDVNARGRMSFTQFCEAMRRLGYSGQLKVLWESLVEPGADHITLANFDKDAHDALQSFRTQLMTRHGNIVRAWNEGLDPTNWGRLDEEAFIKSFQEMELEGDPKVLFSYLQVERTRRFITMADIDPKAREAAFRGDDRSLVTVRPTHGLSLVSPEAAATEQADSEDTAQSGDELTAGTPQSERAKLLHAAFRALDTDGDGRLQANEAKVLARAGSDCRSAALAKANRQICTAAAAAERGVTRAELSALLTEVPDKILQELVRRLLRRVPPASPTRSRREVRTTTGSRWAQEIGTGMRADVTRIDKEEAERRMTCTELQSFRHMLVQRFGSSVTAWRCALDMKGIGKLPYNEFCGALRGLTYQGDLNQLWAELGGKEVGFVTLAALDPEAGAGIRDLRERLLARFGSLLDSWHSGLDDAGTSRLDESDFAARMKELGLDLEPKELQKRFRWLIPERGGRYLYVEDLRALLIGVPNSSRKLLWAGSQKAASPSPRRKDDMSLRALEAFKALLTRHFGTIYAGWCRGIDTRHAGTISIRSFTKALQTIGFMGNTKALLKALGKESGDMITLADIDEELHDAAQLFQQVVVERYGSMPFAWRDLDDGSGFVDESHFLRFCADMDYPGDARKLFRLLVPEGRSSLCMEDFGPMAPGASAKVGRRRPASTPAERQGGRSSPLMSPKPKWWSDHRQRAVVPTRAAAQLAGSQNPAGGPATAARPHNALDALDAPAGLESFNRLDALDAPAARPHNALDALDAPASLESFNPLDALDAPENNAPMAPPQDLASQVAG